MAQFMSRKSAFLTFILLFNLICVVDGRPVIDYPLVKTIVGSPSPGSSPSCDLRINDEMLGNESCLKYPADIATDPFGNVYVIDKNDNKGYDSAYLRHYNAETNKIVTVLGSGQVGLTANNFNTPSAMISHVFSDDSGSLTIVDSQRLRRYDFQNKAIGMQNYYTAQGNIVGIAAAKDGRTYIIERSSDGAKASLKVVAANGRAKTIFDYSDSGPEHIAFDPIFQDKLYFATYDYKVKALYLHNKSVVQIYTFDGPIKCLCAIGGRYILATHAEGVVSILDLQKMNADGYNLMKIGNSERIVKDGDASSARFYNPRKCASKHNSYHTFFIIDGPYNENHLDVIREIALSEDRTVTPELTRTVSFSESLTKARTVTPPLIVTTTTEEKPVEESTTEPPLTETSATERPTDITPAGSLAPPYTTKQNTFFIFFRIPSGILPMDNEIVLMEILDAMWMDIVSLLSLGDPEKGDIGEGGSRGLGNGQTSPEINEYLLVREVPVNASTGEVVLRLQVPNGADALYVSQTLALADWHYTNSYLSAHSLVLSNTTNPFCASCAGDYCNEGNRPLCAKETNNGLVEVRKPRTYACEEWWCITLVFLSCLVVGIIIAIAAFHASRSAAYRRYQLKARAIREVHIVG